MKFKEYLKEDETWSVLDKFHDWLKDNGAKYRVWSGDWEVDSDEFNPNKTSTKTVDKDDIFTRAGHKLGFERVVSELQILYDDNHTGRLELPTSLFFIPDNLTKLTVANHGNNVIKLDRFDQLLDTRFLKLHDKIEVHSFSGIEKLTRLKYLTVNDDSLDSLKNPMLLLKSKSLKDVDINVTRYDNDDKDVFKALKIVMKHLDTKDLAECADELYDAGLEEYATL